jgi:hypothetical protein
MWGGLWCGKGRPWRVGRRRLLRVIPAKAGTMNSESDGQPKWLSPLLPGKVFFCPARYSWVPAFAGMTPLVSVPRAGG